MFKKYSSFKPMLPQGYPWFPLTIYSLFGLSLWSHQLTSKNILGKELYYKYNFILFPVNASITIFSSYNFFNIYNHLQMLVTLSTLLWRTKSLPMYINMYTFRYYLL